MVFHGMISCLFVIAILKITYNRILNFFLTHTTYITSWQNLTTNCLPFLSQTFYLKFFHLNTNLLIFVWVFLELGYFDPTNASTNVQGI